MKAENGTFESATQFRHLATTVHLQNSMKKELRWEWILGNLANVRSIGLVLACCQERSKFKYRDKLFYPLFCADVKLCVWRGKYIGWGYSKRGRSGEWWGNCIVRRFMVLCSSDIIRKTQSRQSRECGKGRRVEGALLITGIKLRTAQNMGNFSTVWRSNHYSTATLLLGFS